MKIGNAVLRVQGSPAAGEKKTRKRRPTPVKDAPTEQNFTDRSRSFLSSMSIWLPIRTVSEANQREFWAVRNKRKKAQQAIVASKFAAFTRVALHLKGPWRITLTRVGPRLLDDDNNAGSLKHVGDQVAKLLGIDDGDRTKAEWKHDQMKQPFYAVRVHIETKAGAQ